MMTAKRQLEQTVEYLAKHFIDRAKAEFQQEGGSLDDTPALRHIVAQAFRHAARLLDHSEASNWPKRN